MPPAPYTSCQVSSFVEIGSEQGGFEPTLASGDNFGTGAIDGNTMVVGAPRVDHDGLMDAGAVSVFLWCFQYREDLYKIFDHVAGARFTVSHSRIGGLASDVMGLPSPRTPRAL